MRLGQPLVVDLDKVDAVLLGVVIDVLQLLEGPLARAAVAGVPEHGDEVPRRDHFLELAGVNVSNGGLLLRVSMGDVSRFQLFLYRNRMNGSKQKRKVNSNKKSAPNERACYLCTGADEGNAEDGGEGEETDGDTKCDHPQPQRGLPFGLGHRSLPQLIRD